MAEIVLNPDPRSTYGASKEYRDAWFAAYGATPANPDPPDFKRSVYIGADDVPRIDADTTLLESFNLNLSGTFGPRVARMLVPSERQTPVLTRPTTYVMAQRSVSTINAPMGFPSVIRVDDLLTNPRDKYYAFSSTDHSGAPNDGIYLWTFGELGEPWTFVGKIINHPTGEQTETPCVVWDEVSGTFRLYAQAYGALIPGAVAGQVTCVWTITPAALQANPAAWTYVGISHDYQSANDSAVSYNLGGMHTGYQIVQRVGGMWVSRGIAVGGNFSRYETWYSNDGLKFYRNYVPNSGQPDISPSARRYLLSQFVMWNGQLYGVGRVINAGGAGGVSTPAELVMGPVRDDLTGFAGVPETIYTPGASGSGVTGDDGSIKAFQFYVEDGRAHLFYHSEETTINYAREAA